MFSTDLKSVKAGTKLGGKLITGTDKVVAKSFMAIDTVEGIEKSVTTSVKTMAGVVVAEMLQDAFVPESSSVANAIIDGAQAVGVASVAMKAMGIASKVVKRYESISDDDLDAYLK